MKISRLAFASIVLLPSVVFAGPFEQGVAALDAKDYDRAIGLFDACLRADPRDVSSLCNRGLAYAGKKDFDRAIADSSEAILVNPRIAILFVCRANARSAKRQYDRAIADYTQALKLNSKLVVALSGRADAHADNLEFDKAIADYTVALQFEPHDAVLLCNRGTALINRKFYAKAIADFREALRLDPKYVTAWNQFAWLLATCPNEQLRDGKMAVEYATRACELSGWKVAGVLTTLAAAHAECGDFQEAIHCENRAIGMGLASKYEIDRSRIRLKLYQAGQPFHNE